MTPEALTETAPMDTLFEWPLFGLQDDVRPALARARERGVQAVLATLYAVDGAAPRGVGAQMLVAGDEVTGFLSGGCIEADIVAQARLVMARGRPERLIYGDGGPIDVRLPCGSRIEVLLEAIGPDDTAVDALLSLREERRQAVWLTTGLERACRPADATTAAWGPLQRLADLAQHEGPDCGRSREPFGVFRRFLPPRRLITIGADPIALAVARLAVEMGFETLLARPLGPETCPIRGVRYVRSNVDAAFDLWRPDPWTAVAVLGHDLDLEQAALQHALASDAGYVGVLGSRRRIPERNARLKTIGVSDDRLSQLHAPIGLPIGGKSPWEIAVAIMAEVVAELDAGQLR